ncbi:MAG: type II toxin-antitoxin system ParD family antitoxin [Robiginitomaculum sp.]|nr:MAG: type II toxin-antitoxin system ParD family antitoxin [Robiginitomaculum sp.]
MSAHHAKSIALTSKWTLWIDELVAEGEYKSASEVMRDGLRALAARRELHAVALEQIRARIGGSLDQADAGNYAQGSGEDAVRRAFEPAAKKTA